MSLSELVALQKEIEQSQCNLLEQERRAQRESAVKLVQFLKANRNVVLPLLEHSSHLCSDEHPDRGLLSDEDTCPKCHLIEILDGIWKEDGFKIQFDVKLIDLDE